jgi:GH15 family glucan-1,4-alpha-glucosidase
MQLLRPSGPLRLLGEHVDVKRMEFTGNFPQGFVHAGVVSAVNELWQKE